MEENYSALKCSSICIWLFCVSRKGHGRFSRPWRDYVVALFPYIDCIIFIAKYIMRETCVCFFKYSFVWIKNSLLRTKSYASRIVDSFSIFRLLKNSYALFLFYLILSFLYFFPNQYYLKGLVHSEKHYETVIYSESSWKMEHCLFLR
jgi:hypothetical protein